MIEVTDPEIVRALAHPLRRAILTALRDRVASPRELSLELSESLPKLSYHFRQLALAGLIRLVHEEPRRGVKEHFYTAAGRTHVSAQTYESLPSALQHSLIAAWVLDTQAQLYRQLEIGALGTADARLNRAGLSLDSQAHARLVRALDDLYALAVRLEEQSRSRKARKRTVNLTVVLAVEDEGT